MTLEYIVEKLGYEMHDNIIRQCKDKLDKVFHKGQRTEADYISRVKAIIAKA